MLARIHDRLKEQARVKNAPKWVRNPKDYIQDKMYIRTKEKTVIPLLFNPIQSLYWMEQTKRDIILKPRQMGFSTLTIARFFECVINDENVTAVIIAHDTDSTQKMFQAVQLMYDRLPEAKKEQLNNGRNKPKYGNRKEFYFAGNNSRIYVGTAGTDTFGRSQTINYLLCSEVAFWPNPEELMTGLLQSVPYDGEIVIESTANGVGNHYHRTYEDAKKGANNWKPHFYAWFQHPEYQLPLDENEQLTYTEDEQQLVDAYKLIPEQIKWRRWKISEMPEKDGFGKEDRFKQEYPSNDVEAFLMSGRSRFDVKKLNRWMMRALPGQRGYLEYGKLVLDEKGYVEIWDMPVPGKNYVIAADTSQGLATGDYSGATVWDAKTWKQVARWHGHIDPDLFGDELAALGTFYNTALIAVESNNHGFTTLNRLKKLNYAMLFQMEKYDEATDVTTKQLGFHTNLKTKPLIIDHMAQCIRENLIETHDRTLISECITYIRIPNGSTNAQEGCFDDLVMASAIALFILSNYISEYFEHAETNAMSHVQRDQSHLPHALRDNDDDGTSWHDL